MGIFRQFLIAGSSMERFEYAKQFGGKRSGRELVSGGKLLLCPVGAPYTLPWVLHLLRIGYVHMRHMTHNILRGLNVLFWMQTSV
jgi:hypothetical protein